MGVVQYGIWNPPSKPNNWHCMYALITPPYRQGIALGLQGGGPSMTWSVVHIVEDRSITVCSCKEAWSWHVHPFLRRKQITIWGWVGTCVLLWWVTNSSEQGRPSIYALLIIMWPCSQLGHLGAIVICIVVIVPTTWEGAGCMLLIRYGRQMYVVPVLYCLWGGVSRSCTPFSLGDGYPVGWKEQL